MPVRELRLRYFTALALIGLIGLFSCAHLDEEPDCRDAVTAESKDPNCPPRFQRPEGYRPGYMNGR